VFSHESAALLLEMPIIGEWPTRPHVTVPRGGGKSSPITRRTERALPPELLAGRSAGEVVLAEKRREDELRDRARACLRVSWADAWAGTGLQRKLLRAGVPRLVRRGPLTF